MYGRVVKGIGGFYFVSDGRNVIMGTARGTLKKNKNLLYIGDLVDYEILDSGDCIITGVHERKNFLSRPPVSNLDLLVVVFSAIQPKVSFLTLDKLCVGCEYNNIPVALCMTKKDLVDESVIREVEHVYSGIYPFITVNGMNGEGLDDLRKLIHGKNAALAGPSGVGKSTLLNALIGDGAAETGEISTKTRRGKHTTRHVEMFRLDADTYVYDTPGFTSIEIPTINVESIREMFPEFREYRGKCRYSDCMHLKEPDCGVKAALSKGNVAATRYDSYIAMIEEEKKCRR